MAELRTRTGVVVNVDDDRADTLEGPYWRPAEGGGDAPAQSEKKPEPKRATRRGDDK